MNPTPDQPTPPKLNRVSGTELLINSTLCNFYFHYNDAPEFYRGCIRVAKNGAMLYDWLMREKAFEIPQDVKNEIWKYEKEMYELQLREGLRLIRYRKQTEQIKKEFEELAKGNTPPDLVNYYKTGLVEWQLDKLKKEDITVNVVFPER